MKTKFVLYAKYRRFCGCEVAEFIINPKYPSWYKPEPKLMIIETFPSNSLPKRDLIINE